MKGVLVTDAVQPARRRYRGFMSDSTRWDRLVFRPDDVVISTPSKCGTTWMQTIVGMLLLDRVDLGAPIGEISPWLDALIRTDDEIFDLLDAQSHRRFMKTHTPLDGIPRHHSVTYIAVIRHPLDVALSDLDHYRNQRAERIDELRDAVVGEEDDDHPRLEEPPEDPAEYLRWFIENHEPATGAGPHGLEDYCDQVRTYWSARHDPNVHLFHYADLWADRDAEMRRVASALGVAVEGGRWPSFVAAAGIDAMRGRAEVTAPEAQLGIWTSPERFFHSGGTRDWASLLDPSDRERFEERLRTLAGDAAGWVLRGRAALGGA